MINNELIEKLLSLLQSKQYDAVKSLVQDMNEVDVAEAIEEIFEENEEPETLLRLFRLLPNGLSERGLEILGVEKRGFVTLSPAREVFDTEPVFEAEVYNKGFRHSPDLITVVTEETVEGASSETVPGDPAAATAETVPAPSQVPDSLRQAKPESMR